MVNEGGDPGMGCIDCVHWNKKDKEKETGVCYVKEARMAMDVEVDDRCPKWEKRRTRRRDTTPGYDMHDYYEVLI